MNWILEYSPIFFDFDGLLVNTEHLHYEAYRHMLEGRGCDFEWDFPTFASIAHKSATGLRLTIMDTYPELKEIPWDTLYEEKKQCYMELLRGGNLEMMPGAEEVLLSVQEAGIPNAVVTNSTSEQVRLIKSHLPILEKIPTWITREDYPNPKPSPDAYLKAIEALGGAKEKMLGFEDALRGIRALEGAHITPVLICPSDHPQMSEVEEDSLLYFPSFKELLAALV